MKRLDITPLIDILFILLFAILINGNTEMERMIENERRAADAAVEALSASPQRVEHDEALAWAALQSRVRVVKVELRGSENRLYLDGKATGLFLVESVNTYIVYKEQLETELRAVTEGDDSRLILFLLREDGRVYRYAWMALLEGVRVQIRDLGEERAIYAIAPTNGGE